MAVRSGCTVGSPPLKCRIRMPLRLKMSQACCASARDTQRRESAGSRSWAKLQKAQRALQALVMEKWHTPGPPSHRVSRAILTTERGFEAALRIAPLPSHADHARQAGGRSRYAEVAGTVLARSQSQSDPGAPS